MKVAVVLQLLQLSALIKCVRPLNFFGLDPSIHPYARKFALLAKSDPHPPDNPPPSDVLEKGVYFANVAGDTDITSAEGQDGSIVNGMTATNNQPTKLSSDYLRIDIDEETKAKSKQAVEEFYKNVIKPVSTMQPGVPSEVIKGAALLGAALGVVTTKGVAMSSAASLSAAYIAISQGVLGDILRTVGEITWDVTEAAATLYQKTTANEKSAGMSKELANKVMAAVATSKSQSGRLEVEASPAYAEEDVGAPEAELARILEEAESAISVADAAIAAADETLGKEDDTDDLEAEAAQLEEEARIAEAEALKAEEEARLLAEAALVEEESQEMDQDWEDAIALAAEGIVEGKIVGMDEAIADANAKQEWDAAGALAQELQDGPYNDFEDDEAADAKPLFDVLENDSSEESPDSSDDDEFFFDDEIDMQAVAKAAREAVETYDKQAQANDAAKKEQRDEWANSMVLDGEGDEYEDTDSDLAAADDMLPEGDLTDVARAARDAVARMGDEPEEIDHDEDSFEFFGDEIYAANSQRAPVLRDWSLLTVAKLKEELRVRGLKSYGKKAELIKLLEDYDAEQSGNAQVDDVGDTVFTDFDGDLAALGEQARAAADAFQGEESESDSEDWFDDFDDSIDLEELGKQARAAVDASFADEPSDEVLKQLESEEPMLFEEVSTEPVDYESMTVLQLKDELRSKGLRLSGKKAELIERLRSS